ncbi:transposase [Paenibacillus ginsengarvi]|nr:transposase [Paenibacillus ginsengarvi]
MAKPDSYTAIEKLAIVEELAGGGGTRVEVARKYNIGISTLV